MKIVIVNSFDTHGGASIAANRLHRYLLESNVDSTMVVAYKSLKDPEILGSNSYFQKLLMVCRTYLDSVFIRFYTKRNKQIFSVGIIGSSSIVDKINKLNPDIVHLHWITAGMISIIDLSKLKGKVVWSLHDMWAFTGGCHYNNECLNYKNECNKCPILGSQRYSDLSFYNFKLKQKFYPDSLRFIGLSKWITEEAKHSKLLAKYNIINLPNPIDCGLFKPKDLEKIVLNRKKRILFGAQDNREFRKGFHLLNKAIVNLSTDDFEFCIMGSNNSHADDNRFTYLGVVSKEVDLVEIYCGVDLVVIPSIQENFSNMILESLSCGVPVVAFDIGGNSDMIRHKFNGYLAEPFSTDDLLNGILWCIDNKNYLNNNSRKFVLDNFDKSKVIKDYLDFYESFLNA